MTKLIIEADLSSEELQVLIDEVTILHRDIFKKPLVLQQCSVSGSLPPVDLETNVEGFIAQNRKICWEAEFEEGEYCVGENRLRMFIRSLGRQ